MMPEESAPLGALFEELRQRLTQPEQDSQTQLSSLYGRQPPHALDAERGVLCALLIDPDAMEQVNLEGLRPEDFYHPAHAVVFTAMMALSHEHEPINTVTVVDELIQMQKLDQVGGPALVAQLETLFPTSAHMNAYAKLVKDKSTLRKLIAAATKVVQSSYRQDRKVVDVIDEAERVILQIRDEVSQKGMLSIQDLVNIALKRLELMYNNKTSLVGISSGFHDLDRLTSGLQPGELIVVAARPSMGKTAFTLNIASHVAMQLKIPVAFFSLEMGAEQLVHRLIGAEARLDLSNLRRGMVQRNEFAQLVAAAGQLGEAPLYIDETPALSIAEMRNKCRRMVLRHDVKMVIVDYLQLMTGPEGYENKATEVAEISKGLKSIARELKVPVIALSQLNRGVESRTDKRPMMSDLRESGAIEQDADVIAFLYREEYYLRDKTPEDKLGIAEIIVAKNRNGPTGQFELRFFNNITRFTDLDHSGR
ncbi:MAG: replicative DNA helicase [Myxococcaceae bacterium]|nr:replicative DNA helicase [Myxococcaceae bacterium]MBH2006698.1 replicative DNA helicase [Myxococcaceae bacterium]